MVPGCISSGLCNLLGAVVMRKTGDSPFSKQLEGTSTADGFVFLI
ncbi:hypothetical protein Nmel_009797 [Mimus melanotis]